MLVIPIAVKWIMIGRYRPGAYPLWGTFYFRWWFATTIEAAVPVGYLTGTPLLNIYLRLMGAKIGPNVHLASDAFAIYDLLTIGEDSSINADSNLLGYTDRGRPVEDRAHHHRQALLRRRPRPPCARTPSWRMTRPWRTCRCCRAAAVIPRGETWLGSPARRAPSRRLACRRRLACEADVALRRRAAMRALHSGPTRPARAGVSLSASCMRSGC